MKVIIISISYWKSAVSSSSTKHFVFTILWIPTTNLPAYTINPVKTLRLKRLNNLFQDHVTTLFGMETGWGVSGHFVTARQRGNSELQVQPSGSEEDSECGAVERSQNHLCYRLDSQFWWCPVMCWELSMWQGSTMDRNQHHYQDSRRSQVSLSSST